MEASLIVQILELIVLIITAIAIWRTLRINNTALKSNHDWNRRKTTHEILSNFIIGDIPKLTSSLQLDFNCKIYGENSNYSNFTESLQPKKKEKFDNILTRLLNIYEVIAIDIKNHIIEEDISYDYLFWFFTSSYNFSQGLIEKKRQAANDPGVFINFTTLAENWEKRRKNELEPKETEGKEKL